jgi:Meiotically up-regulated gene 113
MDPDAATATATMAALDRSAQLIEDLRAVWPEGEDAAWSAELLRRLWHYRPDRYAGIEANQFGLLLRRAGVPTTAIHRGQFVRRGVRLRDVVQEARGHRRVVYFAERGGLVKIGTTQDVDARMVALDHGDCAIAGMTITPVRLLAVMPGGRGVEAALHELFRALHYDGEWFLLDGPLVDFVSAVAAAAAGGAQ